MILSELILIISLIIIFIVACIDFNTFKIPNWSILILIIFGYAYIYFTNQNIIHFIFVFLFLISLGFALFVFKIWGAGDAKLMASSILFVDLENIYYFVMGAFICAFTWALIFALCKSIKNLKRSTKSFFKTKIPFAPGIFSSLVLIKIFC